MGRKHLHEPLTGRSYDGWFGSKSPTTTIQFCGLLILGGTLVALGLTLLFVTWSKLSSEGLDAFGLVLSLVLSAPSVAIIYFGLLHLKRAMAGRR